MPSDIRLDKINVVAECHQFKVEGNDLVLCSPKQSRNQISGPRANKQRRALVHFEGNKLVINFNSDYSGTEIHGPLEIKAKKLPSSIEVIDSRGRTQTYVSPTGEIQTTADVKIPIKKFRDVARPRYSSPKLASTEQLTDEDSIARNLRWFHDRLTRLETRARIGTPDFPNDKRGRG